MIAWQLSLVHTVPVFSPGGATVWTPGPAGKHRIESGYTVLNRRSPGCGPDGLKNKTTGAHRDAIQHRLIPVHRRSSSGMNRFSTVRPAGDTVANRHELCPRWRYGDSRLGHWVSRRRAGVVPVLADRTTVWPGGSRWMSVKLRWSYCMTTEQPGGPGLKYRNSI